MCVSVSASRGRVELEVQSCKTSVEDATKMGSTHSEGMQAWVKYMNDTVHGNYDEKCYT